MNELINLLKKYDRLNDMVQGEKVFKITQYHFSQYKKHSFSKRSPYYC